MFSSFVNLPYRWHDVLCDKSFHILYKKYLYQLWWAFWMTILTTSDNSNHACTVDNMHWFTIIGLLKKTTLHPIMYALFCMHYCCKCWATVFVMIIILFFSGSILGRCVVEIRVCASPQRDRRADELNLERSIASSSNNKRGIVQWQCI